MSKMIWTAYKNGRGNCTGAGYGFKIPMDEGKQHFRKEWDTVIIELPHGSSYIPVEVNVNKASFWPETCGEVIDRQIGQRMKRICGLPWPAKKPWKFEAERIGERRFRVVKRVAVWWL